MSYKVFDLRDTPVEEEHFIKNHLRMHRIKFYETPRGRHSNPAIWVKTSKDELKARKIINECQEKWSEKAKSEYTPSSAVLSKKQRTLLFLVAIVLTMALLSPML